MSGAGGTTPPIVLQIADSCPCSANSKWCCGSGRDHCAEVEGTFKYGCPLPPGPPSPPLSHDPLPNESIHLDLSDIAMGRLQTGDPNGAMKDGVVPTRYKRVPCPVAGNIHIGMARGADPKGYFFQLVAVNVAGLGSVTKLEAQLPSGEWLSLLRDTNYMSYRPQERTGFWVPPQLQTPFTLPVTLRITDASGRSLIAKDVIKSWAAPDPDMLAEDQTWFMDAGVQY
jgi:expansin (peptidoglycan-binding protein)